MSQNLAITQFARDAALEAEGGVIQAARALSARDCGATESEMREARKAYMVETFARFEAEVLARAAPTQEQARA